jgi:hypothetical protein
MNISDLKRNIDASLDEFSVDLLAELQRFEDSAAEKDALLAARDSHILDLETKVRNQEAEISVLRTEIERLKTLIPPKPSDPPIIVNSPPSFSLTVSPSPSSPPVTLKPSGPGIPNPYSTSERRWFWDLDSEIRIILDAREHSNEHHVTFQRAWSDLPLTAPVRELRDLLIFVEGEGVEQIKSLRLGHHTRPTITRNRDIKTVPQLPPYLLPNYETPKTSAVIDWRWNPSIVDAADPITENYHLAHQSWTGGVPLSNEASMFPTWDVMLLLMDLPLTNRQQIFSTWDSIGNYPVHFYDRESGKPCLPSSPAAASIPVLNLDSFPLADPSTKLKTRSGAVLPIPDMAHNFGLSNLAALSARDLYYTEALESFVLLGSLARRNDDPFLTRSSGLFFSGQVRSTAWWMRDLFHLYLATGDLRFRHQMVNQLNFLRAAFVSPGAADYRPTGLLSFAPRKPVSPWNQFAAPTEHETPTGNHHFLAYVLGEISQHPEFAVTARPILLHVLKVAEGVWHNSPSKYFTPWLRHAVPSSSSSWTTILSTAFKNFVPVPGKLGAPSPGFSAEPLTIEIACWYRAAVIAAVEQKLPWAPEALKWLDSQISVSKRPISWNIKPRIGGTS